MEIQFTKMHGIGNDFVVIDTFTRPISLTIEQVRYIANRQFGIGCDQVLLLEPSEQEAVDVKYRIYNADGGEVMQCGNGARCAAIYLLEKGILNSNTITAETGNGRLILQVNEDNCVTVNMGIPEFEPTKIPLQVEVKADNYQIDVLGESFDFAALSLGNPHAVIQVDDVAAFPVADVGPAIQAAGIFPAGVNVGFMEIKNKQAFKLRVYERGAGETLACGSGACAAMVIACQQGHLEGTIDAELKGGHLSLQWAGLDEPVLMTGPATKVFEGKITL